MPVPRATLCRGSSAMWNGMLILSVNRLSNPRRRALVQTVGDFLIAHRNLHRKGRHTVRTIHYVVFRCILAQIGECGTYVNFDSLGHAFADLHIVLAAHVCLDVGREVIACRTDGVVGYDATK